MGEKFLSDFSALTHYTNKIRFVFGTIINNNDFKRNLTLIQKL